MTLEQEKQINILKKEVSDLKRNPQLPSHSHTGFDMDKVLYSNLGDRKLWIYHTIAGTAAATATNYGVFYIVPVACNLTSFKEVHQTLGTDAGAVTVTPEKLTGTQALDAGVEMLSTALSLKTTINSIQTGTITTTLANRTLAAGDRIALKDAGTLTAVAGVTIMMELTIL